MSRFLLKIVFIIVFFIPLSAEESRELKYKYIKGDRYRILSELKQNVKFNGEIILSSEILNKIAIEIVDSDGERGHIRARYLVSQKSVGLHYSPYFIADRNETEFIQDERGVMLEATNPFVPAVRNIPVFSSEEIRPGTRWTYPGEEFHDLSKAFGIDDHIKTEFRVFYHYVEDKMINGVLCAVIDMEYNSIVRPKRRANWGDYYPVKIDEKFNQTLFWDIKKGRPYNLHDNYKMIYHMSNGDVYEFKGYAMGESKPAEYNNKEILKKSVEESLTREGIEDVEVEITDKGVLLSLDNIEFPGDSWELMPSEIKKLEKIGEVLKAWPHKDIQITGHTARFGEDNEEYLFTLSRNRAGAVAGYFIKEGIREASTLVVAGMGGTMPVASNETSEGRRKNRRVEIVILDN